LKTWPSVRENRVLCYVWRQAASIRTQAWPITCGPAAYTVARQSRIPTGFPHR